MSGDVQPRKRRDKKKKRDDDESSHGVHITKMGTEDVHLHVHQEHGTGGHWCAKVFFFSLLAILLGLIGLIILENRGLSDLDTPLSQSRFSNYFDGWVEENRVEHEEHDAVQASIEEHDEHDEPFEEEEDQSEDHEDENATEEEEEDDHDHEDDDEDEDDDEQNATAEAADDDDEEENNNENVTAEEEEEEEEKDDDDDVENDDDDNATAEEDNDNNATAEDDDNEDNATVEEENEEEDAEDEDDEQNATEEENATIEQTNENDNDDDDGDGDENNNNDDDDAEDDNNDNDDDDDNNSNEKTTEATSRQQSNAANNNDDDDDPFDEEDDDGTFESLENVVVDNDAEELLLLQEKARQQAAEAAKNSPASAENDDDDDPAAEKSSSWASSLAVKIGVGVALAIVARLVLIRNNSNTIEEPSQEILMKRRLTIASAEDVFPEDEDASPLLDDEYSDEEIEYVEEEEIEYIDEEVEEIEIDENGDEMPIIGTYAPETFEQLSAMYRSQDNEATVTEVNESPSAKTSRGGVNALQASASSSRQPTSYQTRKAPAVFNAPPPPPIVEAKIKYNIQATAPPTTTIEEIPKTSASSSFTVESASPKTAKRNIAKDSPRPVKREIASDSIDDIEYDDDDISDVDDTELMSRLEAKYGRLPAKEFESDEDPDDPTWTQIKPKQTTPGSRDGPQAHDDDDDDFDMFERELRRANEQMMRDNYPVALKMFTLLSQKYPDKPQAFLGKAKSLDHIADQQRSNKLLQESLEAYKRYLAFGGIIKDNEAYRATAERCIERMQFMGLHRQAVFIHEQLIERFNDEPNLRNQLAVTLLISNRLSDAKLVLQETLSRWPLDGYAQVHYGFILKNHDKDYKNAIIYLQHGINSKAEGTQDGRFFFHLGDAYQRLGRQAEALKVYKHGVDLKLFPSVYQRSLYNEQHLRAQPFWTKDETTYAQFLNKLEQNWLAIRDEGLNVLSKRGYFQDEVENLRDFGDWKQFELYARGQRNQKNCQKAPISCGIIAHFHAASGCRRGQIKFSVLHPDTHVVPHCGPTNCRLRAHLGLVVPPTGTRLRVAEEERTWTEGKFLIFDDSFEHEVWHNGSSLRLVLIVDFWHPDLSEKQRQSLSPI